MHFVIKQTTIVYKLLDEYGRIVRYGETLEREFKARMKAHNKTAEEGRRRITYEIVCKMPNKKMAKRKETTLIQAYVKRYGYRPGCRPGDPHPCRNRINR